MEREINGVVVLNPPGFEPFTGGPNAHGFVLDEGSLMIWANDGRPFAEATRALEYELKDLQRLRGSFDIEEHRVQFHSEDFVETTSRLLGQAFPDLDLSEGLQWKIPRSRKPFVAELSLEWAREIWTTLRETSEVRREP